MEKRNNKKRFPSKNKRALSAIVANLLLVLLVLIAIGIVWVVVHNLISGGSNTIGINQFTIALDIKSAYVLNSNIFVTVQRNSGEGNLTGIRFVFFNGLDSITVDRMIVLQQSDIRTFTFIPTEVPGIGVGDTVTIIPIYYSSGTQSYGQEADSAVIGSTALSGADNNEGTGGIGPTCGNGIQEDPETCDDGNTVSGDGCSSDCTIEESPPASCNVNGILDPEEICDDVLGVGGQTCTGLGYGGGDLSCVDCNIDTSQCIPILCDNNGTVDLSTEPCDGLDFNGQSCSDFGDFNVGDLSCNYDPVSFSCNIDTSGCITVPPACNEKWEVPIDTDAGLECEIDVEPNCIIDRCLCDRGFSPRNDGSGTCALDPPLLIGSVGSIWHDIYFDSNDLPKNSGVSQYQGRYINFSDSQETGCFQISFAAYIQQDDISYLRLSDPISGNIPNIASGNIFSIWNATNCGSS